MSAATPPDATPYALQPPPQVPTFPFCTKGAPARTFTGRPGLPDPATFRSGMSKRYYWEDFPVGRTLEIGEYTVSREEILDFATRFDPQPFHVDEEAARESIYGGLIASGWHTCAIAMRMMCDSYLLEAHSMGSPGVEDVRWLRPVRPGDTLRGRMTVLEARPSRSKPDRGTVRCRWEIFDAEGEQVLSMEGYGMFRRRSPGGELESDCAAD
jgi:acyl dehydratase